MDRQGFDQLLLENTENKCVLPPPPSSLSPPSKSDGIDIQALSVFVQLNFLMVSIIFQISSGLLISKGKNEIWLPRMKC